MRPHVTIPLNVFDHNLDIVRDYYLYDELSIRKGIVCYSSWAYRLDGGKFTECYREKWASLKDLLKINGYKIEIKPMYINIFDSVIDDYEFLVFENTRHNLDLLRECVNDI